MKCDCLAKGHIKYHGTQLNRLLKSNQSMQVLEAPDQSVSSLII